MLSILIMDSDLDFSEALGMTFEEKGYSAIAVDSADRCLELLRSRSFDLIFLELNPPGADGIQTLKEIKKIDMHCAVVMLANHGEIESAVKALKTGAIDVYVKPITPYKLLMQFEDLEKELQITARLNRKSTNRIYSFEKLVSNNYKTQKTLDEAKNFAQTDVNILITGESGTGKGFLARTIHNTSRRGKNEFIEINCSAIPSGLLESELFGYERGAFTDAKETRRGLFEIANHGSLFLDEISTMDFSMQSKLLKVIEDFKFYRVGGRKEINIDTRIIAATNANLTKLVAEKTFRKDLYYRLNVAVVNMPPLRERREDIVDLFLEFVNEFNSTLNRSVSCITPDVAEALKSYNWPGNIRELRNLCERIMVIIRGDTINMSLLPHEIKSKIGGATANGMKSLEEIERDHIMATLDALKGNKSRAAKVLGISRTTLISKVKQYRDV
ncbi:sigma-54-dependent Fis family transcriptional regulator [bacterium]|nr:sigma-54-dependent Fis family transcriptional regulator [bacterium]